MKKILFVIPSLSTGGTNSSLDSLYLFLKNEYDIRVFAMSHQPYNSTYSFNEALLPRNLVLSILCSSFSKQKGVLKILAFFLKVLRFFLFKINIDYLKLHGRRVARSIERHYSFEEVIAYEEGVATGFVANFYNPNKIGWIHSNYNKYLPEEKTEAHIYSAFKSIVCVSNYTAQLFRQRYPLFANKTIVIPNLIDSNRIYALSNLPIDDGRFQSEGIILLSVGRFSPVKRFRDIPCIASQLKKDGCIFNWFVIGPADGLGEWEVFSNNIKLYDVEDSVIWLGGKANPYPYFKASDLYVCLSESEACPMVFKEAKLFNLPIVTTNFPSAFEFVKEEDGFITPFSKLVETIEESMRHIVDGEKHNAVKDDNQVSLNRIYSLFV